MAKDTVLILTSPQQLPQAQEWQATIAHHSYRIGPQFRLYRAGAARPPRGGVMVISDQGFDGSQFRPTFCQEVLRECAARGFSGAVLDFDSRLSSLTQCAAHLCAAFQRCRYTLYIPEYYGTAVAGAKVLISSALSGGSLAQRLAQAKQRFGPQRVVLALERSAEDFTLPAPTGCGTPLSQQQLEHILNSINPSVFFSQELCARYFTYMSRESGAHFVLFDDVDTLLGKLEVARRAQIHTFLIPWEEICPCPERFGLNRLHNSFSSAKK